MAINIGNKIPDATLSVMTSAGPKNISTDDIFAGKKVVLFALPGAFTPTCSAAHLPGFIIKYDEIKAKNVDTIACLSVNDVFVMDAWGKKQNVEDNILMLADGSANFTKALGLELDLTEMNFGIRSKRYALIAEDGVVTHLNIDPEGLQISDADTILGLL